MKTIFTLSLLFFFLHFSFLFSQVPSFDWASHAEGDGGLAETLAMASDSLGNIYSAGAFVGDRDFDPATGSLQLVSTNFAQGSARPDVFVQKMDKEGTLMWAFSIGTSQEDKAVDIALDKFGG